MKFGMFYEHQLPQPWGEDSERRLYQEALAQVELGDKLGIDYVWEVEHHFLEEYSHSSAPEIFLAACSQRTQRIRLGHGIVLMPPKYNHPARVAERIATLDLVSNGRADWGTGEVGDRAGDGRLQHPARGKERDVARGDRAGRQHAGDAPLSRLPRQVFRHAVPQPGAQVGAEAAPADVGGVLQARDHPSRRACRTGRADLRVPGTRAGGEMGAGILRHHQIAGMRADRPQRQSEHRAGHRHVVPHRRAGGDPARPRWLPLLRLLARLYRASSASTGPASPICGSGSWR